MRYLALFLTVLFLFSCTNMESPTKLTPEQKLKELKEIGYLAGVEYARVSSKQDIDDARKYTRLVLNGDNVMTSEDLINAGIKKYLQNNPRAAIYHMAAKSSLRLLGFELPSIPVLKVSGLNLKQIAPDKTCAFLEGFLDGVGGTKTVQKLPPEKHITIKTINGKQRMVSNKQKRALKRGN